jgi:cytochrome c-type biogenesis protein CcsB
MKSLVFLLIILSTSYINTNNAADLTFCSDELLQDLPIQQGGRIKPLYVHANETIQFLIGKKKHEGISAIQLYCQLSGRSLNQEKGPILSTIVEHGKVREELGLKDKRIELEALVTDMQNLRFSMMKHLESSSERKTYEDLLRKANLYQAITTGQDWTIPKYIASSNTIEWVPFHSYWNKEEFEQYSAKQLDPFIASLKESKRRYLEVEGDKYLLELHYAKARLPQIAFILSLLALFILPIKFPVALGLTGLTWLTQVILITLRIIISGRAPITNMYETVLFSGVGSLTLAMIIGHFSQKRQWIGIGLGYNLCTLMMINFSGGMLSATISPLVPVLRDNFWLSTHVTTIILSYGALALSWIVTNYVMIRAMLGKLDNAEMQSNVDLTYTAVKFGIVMLAAGIILGGLWADYSWGRFWGWDPKETWSLIALCIYMAILHGRYTSWINPKRFIMATAGAFMSIMMAWFGVNYILATGLHSYGFSQGGAIFLGSFFAIQTATIILAAKSLNKLTSKTPSTSITTMADLNN